MLKKCTVYFHEVQCHVTPINNTGFRMASIYDAIKYIMSNRSDKSKNAFDLISGGLNIVIDIITYDKAHIFGSIGKLVDINRNPQTRTRDQQTLEVINDKLDFLLEQFSFFYIDIPKNKVAILNNSSAPTFRKHFSHWIRDSYPFISHIDFPQMVNPKLDKFKFSEVSKIHYKFAPSPIGNKVMLGIGEVERQSLSNYSEVLVKLSVKEGVPTKKVWDGVGDDYIHYKTLKVYGLDKEGMELALDLIAKTLTYQTEIIMPDNLEELREKIRVELIRCLSTHNNRYPVY